MNEEGLSIDIFNDSSLMNNSLKQLKTTNCLPYILSSIYKKEQNLDECILLNKAGNISECISHNLFLIKNKVLYTPALDQNLIPGIMRKYLENIAYEHNIEYQEIILTPQVLNEVDEVFLTNVIQGIRWVRSYKTTNIYCRIFKTITKKTKCKHY